MKKERTAIIVLAIIALLLLSLPFFAQCPDEGDGRNAREKAQNALKNRACQVGGNTIDSLAIDSVLAPGNDATRFKATQLVTVVGWVVLQKMGGSEQCNCHAKTKDRWDVHLELAANKGDLGAQAMIVEVTPKYPNRDQVDWHNLVGQKVQVTGYLFYDMEHVQNAVNTNPRGTNLWRASVWEVHPVIDIHVVQ